MVITAMGSYATGGIELFPNAEIYMSQTGWLDFVGKAHPAQFHRNVIFTDATLTYLYTRAWERLHLVCDEEILPGFKMFWVGAHHRGSMAVSMNTAKGRAVISDSIFRYGNYEDGIPIGAIENLFEFEESLARLRQEADIIVPAHDSKVFEEHPGGVIA